MLIKALPLSIIMLIKYTVIKTINSFIGVGMILKRIWDIDINDVMKIINGITQLDIYTKITIVILTLLISAVTFTILYEFDNRRDLGLMLMLTTLLIGMSIMLIAFIIERKGEDHD